MSLYFNEEISAMAILDTILDLQSFYPVDLKILNVEDTDEKSLYICIPEKAVAKSKEKYDAEVKTQRFICKTR